MIQRHKAITLNPGHPTNGGMNSYKNFPNGSRRVLSNDNRFTPVVTGVNRNTWEPMYAVSDDCTQKGKNSVPGVFGETFNIPDVSTQIITNGVVELPTNKYLAQADSAKVWHPGQILVLVPNETTGWEIGIVTPTVGGGSEDYTHLQIGVLLTPLEWVQYPSTSQYVPKQPTVDVLVGYNKIPKKMTTSTVLKSAPLATPKVAAK